MKSYCDAKCKCDKIIEHYSTVWSIVIQRSYEVIMHKMLLYNGILLPKGKHCCGKTDDCDVTRKQYDETIRTYGKICSATVSQWGIIM